MKVENLHSEYKLAKNSSVVFSNLNFELEKNSITALCGLNGSGKSTLLSLMAGIKPDELKISGNITLDNNSIFTMAPKERAKKIAFLVQNENNIWDLKVQQLIEEGRFAHHKWYESNNTNDEIIIKEVIHQLQLENFTERSIFTLSGGELQRVRIARALVQESPYVFLDEPLAALDINRQKELMELLKKLSAQGKTIFISIHDINIASNFCSNIVMLRKDRKGCFCGKTSDLLKKEILKEVYDCDFELFTHPVTGKIQVW